jgi:peptidoglycan/LPS O-acetylase OafA/YrhL/lysophospholipase L1-like esterase
MLAPRIFQSRGYVSLDFLRGLAAWAVVIPHFFLLNKTPGQVSEFLSVFAVEVFFVLSGFVLGKQLDYCFEQGNYRSLKVFYARRWMRTLPIYFFVLILMSAFSHNMLGERFFQYLTFTTTWFSIPKVDEYFVPVWSLAIEEWFYLVFPPLLIMCSRFKLSKVYAIAVFMGIFALSKAFYVSPDADLTEPLRRITIVRMDAIGFGYLTYCMTKNYGALLQAHVWKLRALAPALTILCLYLYIAQSTLSFVYASSFAAGAILLAFLYSETGFTRSRAIMRIAAFGAHSSYATYLGHVLVFQLISHLAISKPLMFALYVLGVTGFSVLSFYIIEQPFLRARPDYKGRQTPPESVLATSFIVRFLTNTVVFGVLLVAVEAASDAIYKFKFQPSSTASLSSQPVAPPPLAQGEHADVSYAAFKIDSERRRAMKGSPYKYSSYTVFENRPFSSETININSAGERTHPMPEASPDRPAYDIWVLGASPIFGATNAENWTIPTRLQIHLNGLFPDRTFRIRNLGVNGYLSWQLLSAFQKALISQTPPDAVVAFITNNDHLNMWSSPDDKCEHLMRTAVGSSQILQQGWENLSRGHYVFTSNMLSALGSKFPNFQKLVKVFWEVPKSINNTLHPDSFKDDYRRNRDDFTSRALKCQPAMFQAFQNNIRLMAELANINGAHFFSGTLPEIMTSEKTLIGSEISERGNRDLYFFSYTNDELYQMDKLPNAIFLKEQFVSREAYYQSARKMEALLSRTVRDADGTYLELKEFSDSLDKSIQLFSSTIHFTHEGADVLAHEIARQILESINKT